MSGLLHRLASQVLGPSPLTARARIPARFAPPLEAAPAHTGAQAAATFESPPRLAGSAQASAAPWADIPPAPRELPGRANSGPASQHDGAHPLSRKSDPTAIPVQVQATTPRPPEPLLRPTSEHDPQVLAPHAPTAGPSGSPSVMRASAEPGSALPPPLFATRPGIPVKGRAGVRADYDRSVSGVGAGTGKAIALRIESAQTATSGPPSHAHEVHVHIGRVEVTALHDAPPARSRERSGKKPMSLDDYLAQRQKGSA